MRQAGDISHACNMLNMVMPAEEGEARQNILAAITALEWALGRPGDNAASFEGMLKTLDQQIEAQITARITTIWSN